MPVSSTNLTFSNPITDGQFQAVNSFVSALLDNSLPKTADSGQINPATATFPGTINTSAGYEMREFDDDLQATHPVFIKLSYRRGASAQHYEIGIEIGTGSDGSGNITGQRMAQLNVPMQGAAIASHEWAGSVDTNRFVIAADGGAASGGLLTVERTLDPQTKAPTSEGLLVSWRLGGTGQIETRYVPYTGSLPPAETGSGVRCVPLPSSQSSGLHANGNVAVFPFIFYGIGEMFVGSNIVAVYASDFAVGNTYTANILGANQTIKTYRYTGGSQSTNSTNGRLAYRYD